MTFGFNLFFPTVEEELMTEVVAVVEVTTAVETTGPVVALVVVTVLEATVLLGNPSVVPWGKSLVPEIPPIPSLDEGGNAGNAA